MTIEELIARLGAFDPQLRVVMPGEDYDFCEVASAFEDLVEIDGETVQLADERQGGGVRVIRLFGPDGS